MSTMSCFALYKVHLNEFLFAVPWPVSGYPQDCSTRVNYVARLVNLTVGTWCKNGKK